LQTYDLAIVGAGIVGLAHALAASRKGLKVVVIDRDAAANGASIRNFGFITVTGQERGECWRRAMRSRDVWAEVAPQAGIHIEQRGLLLAAQRPEAVPVLEAFMTTEMGEGCAIVTPQQAQEIVPAIRADRLLAGLHSTHEIRVESRDAIPKLAAWLASAHGVTFVRSAMVTAIDLPHIETSAGPVRAKAAVVCPGEDFLTLFPERIAAYKVTKCKLHMLRVAPAKGFTLGAPVMSDLGLTRYNGYALLPEAAALKTRLATERAEALANGVHLIAVQSADGSLVVGDSHHYGTTPDPFAPAHVDDLILRELDDVLDIPGAVVTERWTGIYPSAADRLMFIDEPAKDLRIVMVTSGTGASTSFAIAEEVIEGLVG
jgi:FAD dependent oxidoreductase TIGR03364